MNSRTVDRRWLIGNLIAGVVLFVGLLIRTLPSELEHGVDTVALGFGFFALAFWSLIITMFVVGIPSRIAINVFIKER